MTREENLHWIDVEIRTWEDDCKSKHPIKEALHAARKALEQEPCEDAVRAAEVVLGEMADSFCEIAERWSNGRDID